MGRYSPDRNRSKLSEKINDEHLLFSVILHIMATDSTKRNNVVKCGNKWVIDMELAATPDRHSSGLRRGCSTATIKNDRSALSVPTLMGYLHAYNAILRSPHAMRRVDVVLPDDQILASSDQRRHCSTATIDIDIMALMLCPSALSVPTLMGHLHEIGRASCRERV